MRLKMFTKKRRYRLKGESVPFIVQVSLVCLVVISSACSELDKPKPEAYYAETAPPVKQEFRWSNGKMPKSFDPALAAAPPETDVARAIYEGLTNTNSKNLEPIPAIATKWKSEEENRIWTFYLRSDAKWSNGETVKAEDFVRSWKRLERLGKDVSFQNLTSNIVGMEIKSGEEIEQDAEKNDDPAKTVLTNSRSETGFSSETLPKQSANTSVKIARNVENPETTSPDKKSTSLNGIEAAKEKEKPKIETFGVEAVGEFELRVSLMKPDKDFPALVAHPLFRPVYPETNFEKLNADIVTNGAFRVSSVGQDGVTVDRAENYWNKANVKLERVRFVPMENAEVALEAYRAGEIDAVTNAQFEPLALKLLMPFGDFKRTVHSALNFYEFNTQQIPFNDKRVREALTISIERERLTDDEMDGSTKPALGFQPYAEAHQAKIKQDLAKAQVLLAEAGFPKGENFPKIRLLINRNNIQQRIARSIAKMWKQNLNVETEILVKESEEIDSFVQSREYDIIRRGVVFPTSDETVNMLAIFSPQKTGNAKSAELNSSEAFDETKPKNPVESQSVNEQGKEYQTSINPQATATEDDIIDDSRQSDKILTEDEAIAELVAIPLYFPTSYSLVKPYVLGFEINTLDASSLIDVSIDSYWQPKAGKKDS
jgi:oligopeptide transport system substrate-binding protein